jgi:hypothetical protein
LAQSVKIYILKAGIIEMWHKLNPPVFIRHLFEAAPKVVVARHQQDLVDLACGSAEADFFEVAYDVAGHGRVVEATVARVRNGIAANYLDPYMRRRDPDSLVVGDELDTDKPTFKTLYGKEFSPVRTEALTWLASQELAVFAFIAGKPGMGVDALAIVPLNASFFALGLAMLQGMIPLDEVPANFAPKAVLLGVPPFRHTHFDGKQIVVHNRTEELYEIFSFNLYPGPSAKKGVYGILIDIGSREGWVAPHCSAVQVITPYDNSTIIMHEGASGGGKSEMLEQVHREDDGRLLIGENILTGERRHLQIPRTCEIQPIADDMAICHPSIQRNHGRIRLTDAEDAWFLRVNHIHSYGTDPTLERITAQPTQPLLFLNIDAVPNSRALIWEHIHDTPEKLCPNPRVIVPRKEFKNVLDGAATIDVRSFGVRQPPCTRENPSYGIMGLFHILPPALAWLWRLVSPRGYDNPSIVDSEGMTSEGVGSYWPFASGKRIRQANLLLDQFTDYDQMRYIITPNQYIGAWKVGFMPQWIAREYLARRGNSKFRPEQILPARSSLLGYALHSIHVEGQQIARWFLQVDTQPEVGVEVYDQGAKTLHDFFCHELANFDTDEMVPLGRQIIECCLDNGSLSDYEKLITPI